MNQDLKVNSLQQIVYFKCFVCIINIHFYSHYSLPYNRRQIYSNYY